MNNARRKAILALVRRLEGLEIEGIRDDLDTIKDEEQEAFDALPESFQNGDKGERGQAAIDALQEAYDSLDSAMDSVREALDNLSTASE